MLHHEKVETLVFTGAVKNPSNMRVVEHQHLPRSALESLDTTRVLALVVVQDLLGHSRIATTQRYCRVSNLKVEKDYYKAMDLVVKRTSPLQSAPAADNL